MKRSTKRVGIKLLKILCILVASPFVYQGINLFLPHIDAMASRLAIISAGTVMPEGGNAVLSDKISQYQQGEENSDISTIIESPQVPQETQTSSESQESSQPVLAKPENAGEIYRKQYTAAANSQHINIGNNAYIRNITNHTNQEVIDQIANPPAFEITDTSEPQVLIMHTHTTEGYELQTADWYDKNFNSRTTDSSLNVVRVGEEITKQLKAAGIGVIHDTTLHDYPTFPGCYDRSAVTVQNYLKQYPSIKIVLDVHRDAIEDKSGVRYAPVANINGKNAAQVMIISGCDDGTMNYPNYFLNLRFAAVLQKQMEGDYPGLTRPVLFDYRKYNQHLTSGSLLLEMGSVANSLEEVIYSGELVGKSLAKAINSMKK